ncbi:MAG: carbohydrate-binding domain-containing protein [Eggerthellaceae bacterium]|jgi:hypothetical protein
MLSKKSVLSIVLSLILPLSLLSCTETEDASAATIDESTYDLTYSDRDYDASYDESQATKITLDGSSASITGEGAEVSSSTVTISQEGTYIISGNLEGGEILVNAPEDAKVQLVLNGAHVSSSNGPALYVQSADKVFVTLADGTTNSLSDSSQYDLEEGSDEPDATLFATSDLTIQGNGTLSVDANYQDGIKSKDDLVVTGGTIKVDASDDCLVGTDCAKIASGTFDLDAQGSGIISSKDDDETKGYVLIDDGNIQITAGNKGIVSETYLKIAGSNLDIQAEDDGLHSNKYLSITGGEITITAADDGIHADTILEINDGSTKISQSEEGIEAQRIVINGGTTYVTASDDALNASSGSTSTTETVNTSESSNSSSTNVTNSPDANEQTQAASASPMQAHEKPNQDNPQGQVANPGAGGGMEADSSCSLEINDGYLVVDSGGDGLDSNGSLLVNGGITLVSGPMNNGNSALDYGTEAQITGGYLIAAGSSGMAESFSDSSQAFALVNASGEAESEIAIADENGNVLASFTPQKSYDCVIVSTPDLNDGSTYYLTVGESVADTNDDGFTTSGSVDLSSAQSFTASCEAQVQGGGGPRM